MQPRGTVMGLSEYWMQRLETLRQRSNVLWMWTDPARQMKGVVMQQFLHCGSTLSAPCLLSCNSDV